MSYFTRRPTFLGGSAHFPDVVGPYVPSYVDIMTGTCLKDGLFVRVFYPSNMEKKDNHSSGWHTYMEAEYLQAYGRISGILSGYFKLIYKLWAGNFKTPMPKNAPIRGGCHPVVIFSHGMLGTRFYCTSVLAELAAHGYVVIALEHRDKSSATTPYQEDNQIKWLPFYEFSKEKGKTHHSFRYEQVQTRVREVKKALRLAEALNKGTMKNVWEDSPDLSMFVGGLDLDCMIMGGHSFGGATALLCMAKIPRFKLGLVIDPWLFPIKHLDLADDIKKPLICLNTHTFPTKMNHAKLAKLMLGQQPGPREFHNVRYTTHEYPMDSIFTVGSLIDTRMKKINPLLGRNLYNALLLKFLHKHLGPNRPEICQELEAIYAQNSATYVLENSLLVDGQIFPTRYNTGSKNRAFSCPATLVT